MNGLPCIRGMRVTVGLVLGQLAAGQTREQILEDYPRISRPTTSPLRREFWRGAGQRALQEPEPFGPRPSRTQRLAATPPSLPDSATSCRSAEALQITDIDPHPILALSAATAPLAPRSNASVVSISIVTSPSASLTPVTRTPSSPSMASASPLPSRIAELRNAVEVVEQLQRWRDPCTQSADPHPKARSPSQR